MKGSLAVSFLFFVARGLHLILWQGAGKEVCGLEVGIAAGVDKWVK